jgi:hypothetical protein
MGLLVGAALAIVASCSPFLVAMLTAIAVVFVIGH